MTFNDSLWLLPTFCAYFHHFSIFSKLLTTLCTHFNTINGRGYIGIYASHFQYVTQLDPETYILYKVNSKRPARVMVCHGRSYKCLMPMQQTVKKQKFKLVDCTFRKKMKHMDDWAVNGMDCKKQRATERDGVKNCRSAPLRWGKCKYDFKHTGKKRKIPQIALKCGHLGHLLPKINFSLLLK